MLLSLQDYTLFEPANTAYTLSNAAKWQPLVIEPVPPYGGGGTGVTPMPRPCFQLANGSQANLVLVRMLRGEILLPVLF